LALATKDVPASARVWYIVAQVSTPHLLLLHEGRLGLHLRHELAGGEAVTVALPLHGPDLASQVDQLSQQLCRAQASGGATCQGKNNVMA